MNSKYIKNFVLGVFKTIKSFFLAVTQVAWGFVSLGLLGWVFMYLRNEYGAEIGIMKTVLPDLSIFIFDHVTLFIWAFFILYMYSELKELWGNKE